MNKYYVVEEGGTFREFAKSHEGLEDAIEFAHDIMGEVMCNQEGGGAEAVWSYESHLDSFTPDTDWDGFNSDAEADADALATVGLSRPQWRAGRWQGLQYDLA